MTGFQTTVLNSGAPKHTAGGHEGAQNSSPKKKINNSARRSLFKNYSGKRLHKRLPMFSLSEFTITKTLTKYGEGCTLILPQYATNAVK